MENQCISLLSEQGSRVLRVLIIFIKRGHNVTLIEKASTPNQECSFGMAGFMGPISVQMLLLPFKKAKPVWPPFSQKLVVWVGMFPSDR